MYEIDLSDKSDSFTWRMWRKLPDSTQEKVAPLLTSMYRHEPGKKTTIQSPVFLSELGNNHKDWLVNWSQFLIDHVEEVRAKSLFEACFHTIKKDVRIAELLLPRIVVEVLCHSSSTTNDLLVTEVKNVIRGPADKMKLDINFQTKAAQTLFTVQDYLGLWLRAKYQTLIAATRKSENKLTPDEIHSALKKGPDYHKVRNFIDNIPQDGMANLSYTVSGLIFSFYNYLFLYFEGECFPSCSLSSTSVAKK